MAFTTDKQTIEDLNIFGKHAETSVFTLFNHTVTVGGAAILEEMFLHPMAETEGINQRSQLIKFFAAVPVFPFNPELFDRVEQYLDNTDERTKLFHDSGAIAKKISSLIAEDPNDKFVYGGVAAIIELIQGLSIFLKKLDSEFHITDHSPDSRLTINDNAAQYSPEMACQKDVLMIKELLNMSIFDISGLTEKSKLSRHQVAGYDVLWRFRSKEWIKKILRYIYHLDVYISIGKVAHHYGFTLPKALAETHTLVLEGLRHPMLPNAVTNAFGLTPQGNVTFLTGANMAGKSTFMKSVGIAVYLAHMGFPVAAERMEFSPLDGIYTTINLPDNLGMGTSHFYAEVLRIKKVAKELSQSKNLFVIIDELFRGTNVKDAYEATIAITAAFAEKRNSMFVISTHIIEAGEVLREKCNNIRFYYLPTHLDENKPVYTYKLEEGITADRHGMIIINNEGILDILKKTKVS